MIKINLLPRKKKAVTIGQDLSIAIISLIVLLGVGIFFYAQCTSKISNLQNQITSTKVQIENSKIEVEKINKLKKDKKKLEKKLDLIKDMKSRQKGPSNLLNDIAKIIPENVWLTSLSSKGPQLSLEGMSLTANTIAHFMKKLESAADLQQIELDKITQTTVADKKVKKFKITCNIKGLKPKQPKNKKKGKS